MAVKVIEKAMGKVTTGKYAATNGKDIRLYSGIMSDKKGGWRGCGTCTAFSADAVSVSAGDPARELKKD
jgi:hypothetical protein